MSSSSLPGKPPRPQPPNVSTSRRPQKSWIPLAVVAILALFVAVSALPQYFGQWPWSTPPKLPAATRTVLQAIPETGLDVSGWLTTDQAQTKLGGETWSVQQLSPAAAAPNSKLSPVFLLLRAPTYGGDQPEVEWLDIKGSQQWQTDSLQKLTLEVSVKERTARKIASEAAQKTADFDAAKATTDNNQTQNVRISTDFFRAWNKDQTYAVMQWYAWTDGGSPSPAQWFWADQKTQWKYRERMPWVALSVWLPIEPFSDIARQQSTAESLAKTLQQTLSQKVFVVGKAT